MNKNLLTRPAQAFYCLCPKTFTINFCTARAKTMRGKNQNGGAGYHDVKNEFLKISKFQEVKKNGGR